MGGRVRKKKKNAIRTSEKQRFPTGFSMIGKKKKRHYLLQAEFLPNSHCFWYHDQDAICAKTKKAGRCNWIYLLHNYRSRRRLYSHNWVTSHWQNSNCEVKHNPVSSIWNSEDRRHNIINTYFVDLIKKNFLLCFAVLICCTVLTSSQYEHSLRQVDTFSLFVNLINYERPLPPLTFLMFICTGSTTFL